MTARRSPSDPTRRAVLAAAAVLATPARAEAPLTVFAAASLKGPLDAIASAYAEPVRVSYAGSGALARQVAAGAPADVVVLAAVDWADWLLARGVLEGDPVDVAGNRLALAGPAGAAPLEPSAPAILDRLGRRGRLAMGDPMSVPAGRYAQQALETMGAWGALDDRLLLSESVSAALAYVARGAAPVGLVYRSDLRRASVAALAQVPPEAHAPIRYPAAVVRGARPGARALLDAVAGADATFAAHGFAA